MKPKSDDILHNITQFNQNYEQLHKRQDFDLGLLRNLRYNIDKKEGSYESFTSNSASTMANKVIEMLSFAKLKLQIPLDHDANEADRESITNTEKYCHGCLHISNELLKRRHQRPIQLSLSWATTIRGWYAERCVFRTEKKGKSVIPDVAIWDPRAVSWGYDKDGLAWVCNSRYADVNEVNDYYKLTGRDALTGDYKNRVLVYDYWDDTYETVVVGEKIGLQQEHKVGHLPATIQPVGANNLISVEGEDLTSLWGESIYANDRNLFEVENRIGSYYLTSIALGTKTPVVLYYKGAKPPKFDGNPYQQELVIPLSVDRAERFEKFIEPTMPKDANAFLQYNRGLISLGGMAPVSFGEINQQLPASGIAQLRHSAQSVLNPREMAVEEGMEWICNEYIQQYNDGKFGEMELEGVNNAGIPFRQTISRSDIVTDRRMMVKLLVDMPQDEFQQAGIITQLVQSDILSRRAARDRMGIDDPDAEEAIINLEKVKLLPDMMLREAAAEYIREGSPESLDQAELILAELSMRKQQIQMQQQGSAPVAGVTRSPLPNLPVPPQPLNEANRIAQISGGRQ